MNGWMNKMNNLEKLCKTYKENKVMIDMLKKENKDLKKKIIAALDGQSVAYIGCYKVTYTNSVSMRFSSTLLKKCDIETYDKYLVATPSSNFRIY